MNKPPVTIFYPSYVVEYASTTDHSITYKNRRNATVDGKCLEDVPKLAICLNIETQKYTLAHCSTDWELLCGVESHKTIEETKQCAEHHYAGVTSQWVKTGFKQEDAIKTFDKERQETTCSFCGKNSYDQHFSSLVTGKNAKICNICVNELKKAKPIH